MTPVNNVREFTIEDNVLKGKVVPYHEDHTSLGEFVLSTLQVDPNLVGQIDAVTGKSYTYRTMRERSVKCALWLKSQGLRPRDVVAFCTDDHMDYTMAFFAVQYLGAVPTPWDVTMNENDFHHRMKITRPRIAFTNGTSVTAIAEAAKMARLDLKIIVFGSVPGFLEFDSVIAEPDIGEIDKFCCTPIESSDEIALILFSSGTTGPSKGVALSHRAFSMLLRQRDTICKPGNVCLTFSATDWITSTESVLKSLFLKIPRLILPTFEAHSACAAIERYKGTWIFLSPTMINELLKSDALGRYDLSTLTEVFYSGAQLYIETYRAVKEFLPNVRITSGYGLTETCGFISVQSERSQPCSCGEIMENSQVKVIDPDTGRTLGANQKGELLLKFICMMNCYLDDPQATRNTIDEDGWLHSGDLGYYDENGEIFLTDRLKDVIRCVDYDISPTEIENVIWSHPGVKDVAVVGQPRPPDEDLLIAFVVRSQDFSNTEEQVTEKEIVDLVAAELPDSRRLRAGVRFIHHIPRTPSNKIKRTALRDLARSIV